MKKLFDRVDKFVNHAPANTNSLVGKVGISIHAACMHAVPSQAGSQCQTTLSEI